MAAGKVTGTNREVKAVVAASFAARTAASSYRACSAAGLSDGCRELASLSVGRTICER